MSTARRRSVLLCSSVPGVRRLGCGEVGVPSSLIDGGFPASTVDDCTRLVNKTAFFPTGGVDGGVKLLVLLLLSVGLVLGTIVDSSLSSFTESGVLSVVDSSWRVAGRWLLRHFQRLGVALKEGRWNLPGFSDEREQGR
ncbi:hypothetical protein PVAP13_4KG209605 [Panicum virgatum]|uniref:Uncharacterized protein n=1 Tax=Panicum virgatum TaxID=38727 RepID=A0A8T0TRJ4_PANVG|nr:hypothetical protein PVAP13_4KG209605 [Panicum virgatum]